MFRFSVDDLHLQLPRLPVNGIVWFEPRYILGGGDGRERRERSIDYECIPPAFTHQLPAEMWFKLSGVIDVPSDFLKCRGQRCSNIVTARKELESNSEFLKIPESPPSPSNRYDL